MWVAAAQVEKTDHQKHSPGMIASRMLWSTHVYQNLSASVKLMAVYDIKNGRKRVYQVEVRAILWKLPAALELVCADMANHCGCISCFSSK